MRQLWFEMTDTLEYVEYQRATSGIQRAILNLATAVEQSGFPVRCCAFDPVDHRFFEVPLATLLSPPLLRETISVRQKIIREIRRIYDTRIRGTRFVRRSRRSHFSTAAFGTSDVLCVFGAFWTRPEFAELLLSTSSQNRMKIALLVHDLIPVMHPAWFSETYSHGWEQNYRKIYCGADYIFSNSRFTQSAVSDHAATARLPQKQVDVLRFGDPDLLAELRDPDGDNIDLSDYVLIVASIDVRKNQTAILSVWLRLMGEMDFDRLPRLVCVGKDGTAAHLFHAMLQAFPRLRAKVTVLQSVDDRLLHTLYTNAMFTIFPSLSEGWGFPVAESLMYGKACVASNSSSIPEVGGDLCIYVAPDDLDAWHREIKALIEQPTLRDSIERKIAAGYRRTGWDVAVRSLIARVSEDQSDSGRGPDTGGHSCGAMK